MSPVVVVGLGESAIASVDDGTRCGASASVVEDWLALGSLCALGSGIVDCWRLIEAESGESVPADIIDNS